MFPWGIAVFLLGIVYALVSRQRLRKIRLMKHGLLLGIVIAAALALIGYFTDSPALGVGGVLAVVWSTLVMTVIFLLGAWLGKVLGPKRKKRVAKNA